MRQLNLYNFARKKSQGTSTVSYYHKTFVRGQRDLARQMIRCKIKGTGPPRSLEKVRPQHQNLLFKERPFFFAEESKRNKTTASSFSRDCIASTFVNRTEQVEDGDLLFFEGSPFHFLDSRDIVGFSSDVPNELLIPTRATSNPRPSLAPRTIFVNGSHPLQHRDLLVPSLAHIGSSKQQQISR